MNPFRPEIDKRDWLLPFIVVVSVHAAILVSAAYLRNRPFALEQTSVSVDIVTQETHEPRQSAPIKRTTPTIKPAPTPDPVQPEPTPPVPNPVSQPSASSPTQTPTIYPPSQLTQTPRFRRRVDVAYPAGERASGMEAQVLAEVVIDTGGHVVEVTIIQSAGANFDASVITALRKSTFTPGYLDSLPVMTRV